MEIIFQPSLGTIERNRLRRGGPNVIFAADHHRSWKAQTGIAQLYLDLAEFERLDIVSLEKSNMRVSQPTTNPADLRTQMAWRRQLDTLTPQQMMDRGLPFEALHHLNLIVQSRHYMGYPLEVVPSIRNSKWSNVTELCLEYQTANARAKRITRRGEEGNLEDWEIIRDFFFQETINLIDAENLYTDLAKEAPILQDETRFKALAQRDEGKLVEQIWNAAHTLRTEEQLDLLIDQMNQTGRSLGLMCMGSDHKGVFTRLARSKGVGSAVFNPKGSDEIDPLVDKLFEIGLKREKEELFRRIAGE